MKRTVRKVKRTVRKVKRKRSKRPIALVVALLLVAICCVTTGHLLSKEQNGFGSGGGAPKSDKSISIFGQDAVSPGEIEEKNGYAVSSCSEYATRVGVQVLEAGGNAVDAAVAMSYALAVAEPYASGLGGGGCMLVYDPVSDHYQFYDYGSEAAKSGASSVTLVPGFVSGMDTVLKDYGTMNFADLLQPAISLCDGIEINNTLATRINAASDSIVKATWFFDGEEPLSTGDTLVQKELKETLIRLAEEGSESFYSGSIAADIAAQTVLTQDDLAAYETLCTEVVLGNYQGYEVASAAAPFSGATLIQMLEMAEMTDLTDPDAESAAFLSGLRTITIAAHKDRISHIYDYRFGTALDQQEQVTESYVGELLGVDVDSFVDEEECEDTTSFTIIDKDGMVVSCTNTLSSFFGNKSVASGFFMNNTGRNFGSGVNSYAPGKRPRSHIAPTILRSNQETIAIATPGGNVIVKVLSTVLIDILQYDTPVSDAIAKQRVLFKTPHLIYCEIGYSTDPLVSTVGSGYQTLPYNNHSYFGNITYSSYSADNGFYAIEDVRREGSCSYFNG